MKSLRKRLSITLLVALVLSSLFALQITPTSALSGSQFNPERIMDDSVFFRAGDLTASQIQRFLNSKVPVCDTNHAYSGSSNDSGPPYTCLKDYKINTPSKPAESELCKAISSKSKQSAAQIIHDVSKACGVSTRVLLVLLQKEQSLITDTWPWDIQYTKATGYGCPDSNLSTSVDSNQNGCYDQYEGFFNQVYYAGRVYKYYDKVNGPNYRVGFVNYVQYHPNTGCGGTDLFLRSQATAGLYNYTPYQPNAAALNNLYGTGDDCSAYGNRNFWRMYNDWFGSTLTNIAYNTAVESVGIFTDSAMTKKYTQRDISLAPGDKAYIQVKVRNTGWKNWDRSFTRIGRHGNDYSPFRATWFKPNRPTKLIEDTVVPGDVGTLEFELTAPSKKGTYQEYFQMLIEGKIWLNVEFDYTINVADPSIAQETDFRLNADEEIRVGENLVSPDLHNTLVLQHDGNLVLYGTHFAKWYTSSVGRNSERLTMQPDGNLVLYDKNGNAIWHTATYGNPGAYFVMQTDGNMVVYDSSGNDLWDSRTVENPDMLNYVGPALYDRAFLHTGQQLETPDGKYRLVLQDDGNLVLYATDSGNALWHTKTYGKPSYRLDMQHDGNLVLYDGQGNALWKSRTADKGYSRLVVQQDGNLVIYDKHDEDTWNTGTQGQN
ncbi:MAG: NBR1-Ig-like domain-containing protein [Candidatus Saccharibacteria bacterium]|nr:NBR1-Ig-like domain-containing protein [Candidatus Saccharibacteria bacterium]